MGTGWSYISRKSTCPRIESDPLVVSSVATEGMAEGKTRDVTRQHTPEGWISQDDFKRYTEAFRDVQEFLHQSGSIIERQRMLEYELETCHERLRRLTEDHARSNESGTENISSSNRPSALERKYTEFYDHERMDAIECIEKSRLQSERSKWTEIDDQRVACMIFEESFAAALSLKESFIQGISLILSSAPSIGAQYAETRTKESGGRQSFFVSTQAGRQCKSLDQSSLNSLNVIMKETAESCDVNALVQTDSMLPCFCSVIDHRRRQNVKTIDALSKRQDKGRLQDYTRDLLTKPAIKTYVERCCRYAWKLVCQTPPYVIEGNHSLLKEVFDPAIHQLSREYASTEHNSGYIQLVVWPGLFEGSSGRVIRRTEVLLQSQ